MRLSTRALALALPVAVLATAAPAQADPEGTITIGDNVLTASWTKTGSGILGTQDVMDRAGCQPGIHECGDQVIKLTEPGFFTVTTSSEDPKAADTDLQLFMSDEEGTVGDELGESAAADPTPNETVGASLDAGYYIVRIDYAISLQGEVKADATFEPDDPTVESE
jgi:hypothetical protein